MALVDQRGNVRYQRGFSSHFSGFKLALQYMCYLIVIVNRYANEALALYTDLLLFYFRISARQLWGRNMALSEY